MRRKPTSSFRSQAGFVLALVLIVSTLRADTIDVSGKWQFQLDRRDEGIAGRWWEKPFEDRIDLPGTMAIAKKGDPLDWEPKLDRRTLSHLQQKFSYVGPAWYRRTVEIPSGWEDKDVELSFERVIWETRVWINGQAVGVQDSLSTPHRFDVGKALKPGRNTIVVRVDNRKKLEIGGGHAYTDETQTIWNGAIGRLELNAFERVRIQHLRLHPNLARAGVDVEVETCNGNGSTVAAQLRLQARGDNFRSRRIDPLVQPLSIPPGVATRRIFFPMDEDIELWSEFNPKVYVMNAELVAGDHCSKLSQTFGMREFKAGGRHFTINGQRTFLRGTLECCIFPETAHPPMDDAKWEKVFSTVKEYGLNHVRFHSWCPPEAAFRVADRHGVYLQVELPNWSFKMGQQPKVDKFFRREGERMLREYAHHPSWVMFSMGNELLGDLERLDGLVAHLKRLEPGLLYTSTSYSWAPDRAPRGLLPGPNDDYFISMETKCGWVRGQGFLNDTRPNTVSDYSEGLSCLNIPLVSHEVGQYNVFPNLAELPKFNVGPLRAVAYEAIQADLKRKGRLSEAPRYTRDSGRLAAVLYKEDIERALRTKDQAGIALLDLHDFPGQSTATVGLLDAFWDSKGLITPREFRRFCSTTVPLVRMAKRVFQNDEVFQGDVEMAHFGPEPITNAVVRWRLEMDRTLIGKGEFEVRRIELGNGFPLGRIQQPLSGVRSAAKLKLSVALKGSEIGNDWTVWVYPAASAQPVPETSGVKILHEIDRPLLNVLHEGGDVLLLAGKAAFKSPLDARFVPVFWSPMHFPNQPGTLGATIDPSHPLWQDFPTDSHTDWQWWELLSNSFAVNLDPVPIKPTMPLRFIDKFNRNALPAALFEVRVGRGRLLVCTLDISSDLEHRIVARQLRRSIFAYMSSREFQPTVNWTEQDLMNIASDARFTVSASSVHGDYPVELAVDGDPQTFWHTDWENGPALPAEFTLKFKSEARLLGFTYLPRQDMSNGRVGNYDVSVSHDGTVWNVIRESAAFQNTTNRQTVKFNSPVSARFLRVTVRSDLGKSGNAAIAEMEPILGPVSIPDTQFTQPSNINPPHP